MRYHKNTEDAWKEGKRLSNAHKKRAREHADISRFYNGGDIFSEDEAEEYGLDYRHNHLSAYPQMVAAKSQLYSLYSKNRELWRVDVDQVPRGVDKALLEHRITKAWNKIFMRHEGFRLAYEELCGYASMHGIGCLHFHSPYGLGIRHVMNVLVPDGTPAGTHELPYCFIESGITIRKLYNSLGKKGWKDGAIRKTLKWAMEGGNDIPGEDDPEVIESFRQAMESGEQKIRLHVPVFYFYEQDPETNRINMSILFGKDGNKAITLFKQKGKHDNWDTMLLPFFSDTAIGGKLLWHNVKGLGWLNYNNDYEYESLLCRLDQGVAENSMTFLQAIDGYDREQADMITVRRNGFLPNGLTFAPNRGANNLSDSFAMLQQYDNQRRATARTHSVNSGNPGGQDLLQVQAINLQYEANEARAARMSVWHLAMDRLGTEVWRRCVDPDVIQGDELYSEIVGFQNLLAEMGLPPELFHSNNVEIRSNTLPGAGNPMMANYESQFLLSVAERVPPEGRAHLMQRVLRSGLNDQEEAEIIYPVSRETDTSQIDRADNENAFMSTEGVAKEISKVDIDETHLPRHLESMQRDLERAELAGAFTPRDFLGFRAKGAHSKLHIDRLHSVGQKEIATHFMRQLQSLSTQGDQFAHNLQEQMEANKTSPIEMKKLEQKDRDLAIKEGRAIHGVKQSERAMAEKEIMGEHTRALQIAKETREAETSRTDQTLNILTLANSVE